MNSNEKLFRIPMQFFAEDGGDNAGNAANENGTPQGDNAGAGENNNNNSNNNEIDIEKLVQARADKITADLGKKLSALQKELDKQKKANLTAEELKQLEMSEKEKELAEREQLVAEQKAEIHSYKVIGGNEDLKVAGLDEGIVQRLILGKDEESIDNKAKDLVALIKAVKKNVTDSLYKQNGRTPYNSGANTESKPDLSIAERLGKGEAEKAKQFTEIMNLYTGGKS